ncbi:MAG: 3-hydroxyacyl-CoA dehydrogenase family protein [Acidobacteriota bacterium]
MSDMASDTEPSTKTPTVADATDIRTLCVTGAGQMGGQIAVIAALAGFSVNLHDISRDQLDRAVAENRKQLARRVAKGRIDQATMDTALERIKLTSDLEDAAQNCDFAIEAVVEKLGVKRDVFAILDRAAPTHAILATNSSYLGNSRIADATSRPEQVVNMHFFYPPMVMKLVEVIRGESTSDLTVARTAALARALGKTPVVVEKEISGFLVNRILRAITNEAYFLYENGYASFDDIDRACEMGLNHPLGPFKLGDLSGLDVGYNARLAEWQESGDDARRPPASLARKVEAGHLGRKTGKGFYDYSTDPPSPVDD